MKARLVAPPWGVPELTEEGKEVVEILANHIWLDSQVEYRAQRDLSRKNRKRTLITMANTLGKVLEKQFVARGWDGDTGCFVKGNTWARITFRQQATLASDILDALKVCKKEGIELAIILAANRDTLNQISPSNAQSLISFEKLNQEITALNGVLDIPLLIGELSPMNDYSQMSNIKTNHSSLFECDSADKFFGYDVLIDYLDKNGLEYIDKRESGGSLWVIGGREIVQVIADIEKLGYRFRYKEHGGKITKGRNAWWTKQTSMQLIG